MVPSAIRLAVFGATAAALVGGVVGCSSSSDSTPSSSSTASATASSSSAAPASGSEAPGTPPGGEAFAQCLTQHGVPAPPQGPPPGGPGGPEGHGKHEGPPPGGEHGTPPAPPGVDANTWKSALDACNSLAPAPPPAG